jgi:hypothetical protein
MRMAQTSGLDARETSPYLACMASRLLLTLLALLTGLAAQGSPAQARGLVADSAEIGAFASANTVQARRVSVARAAMPGQAQAYEDADRQVTALSSEGWRAPTVRPGIDRARE